MNFIIITFIFVTCLNIIQKKRYQKKCKEKFLEINLKKNNTVNKSIEKEILNEVQKDTIINSNADSKIKNDALKYFNNAQSYVHDKKYNYAYMSINIACELEPNNQEYIQYRDEIIKLKESVLQKVEITNNKGTHVNSKKTTKSDRNNTNQLDINDSDLYLKAQELYTKGELSSALINIKKAIKIESKKEYIKLHQLIIEAIKIKKINNYYDKVLYLFNQNDYQEALNCLKYLLANDTCCDRQKKYEDLYSKLILKMQQNVSSQDIGYNIVNEIYSTYCEAKISYNNGNLEQAIKLMKKVCDMQPQHEEYKSFYKELKKQNYINKKDCLNNSKNTTAFLLRQEDIIEKNDAQYWWELDGWQFEKAVSEIFKLNGYNVTLTKGTHDGGVDLILKKDNKITIVQCKHYRTPVPPEPIRALYGCKNDFNADNCLLIASAGITDGGLNFLRNKLDYKVLTLDDIIKLAIKVNFYLNTSIK